MPAPRKPKTGFCALFEDALQASKFAKNENTIFMKFLKNLTLYISAFMPMYFLVLIKLVVELANANLTFNVLNSINLATLLLLSGASVWGLLWNIKFNKDVAKEVTILSKQNITDRHFLGYFSLFVLFAIPLDLSYVSIFCVYIATLVMIGVVYMHNSLYYINPFLNILGYSFYDIEYVEVGCSQKRHAKIFYKGELKIENTTYFVKLKNENFSFVDEPKKKK